ncbi:MAG: ATP-dependent RNA helicase HrpA [Kiritimatiellia bacterium]
MDNTDNSSQAGPRLQDLNFNYPPELPVTAHHDDVLAALAAHPVVVVCGDTGSGKTTQLPKMALEYGLAHSTAAARHGFRVACTQPRRLAAVTMAERVAHELKGEVGGLVGYQHRFGRRLSRETRIKFMTDGVLLAETRSDPLLRAYDAIIVDEVHERSLNIDFLLGILKRILARRRDLRVIVSSATLDVARFSAFFDGAPVVSVPGRLFPIEVRYSPPREDDELDLPRDVAAAVAQLPPTADTLVFLPGEHDIRETADALQRRSGGDDVIPLLASLPASEQQRAFRPSPRRRIILATNVAETSVTIPGIRCVIDSGLARISRYIHRTQVQRLQIEPVSQASVRQRAGRCGRLGPGVCVRLFSEEDFNAREAYTAPEVMRSSLAGVILTMLDLRLGDVTRFPFLDPPKPAMIHEGLRELLELGAVCHDRTGEIALTETGRKLAKIPVEPRLARMLLAAAENAVLPSVIPIVAALSCDDPRRRPVDAREQATQAHAPFRVPGSDFLGTLRLWTWWLAQTADLSQSRARALAKKTYLSYPKMREWRDLVRQLTDLARRLGLSLQGEAPPAGQEAPRERARFEDWSARLHKSLLSGLLGRIGKYNAEEREYHGAHGLRFTLHPGSVLTRKTRARDERPAVVNAHRRTASASSGQPPPWIMAGELVDTARLFARNAAILDPAWIEPVAGPICKHAYHSPEWDAQSGFVRATEQVVLYGLVVVPARRCDFSRVNLPLAREIFIRRGLVDGDFPHPPPEVRQNNALLDALRRRAEKSRRPELFDADRLCAHFAAALPPDVASAPALRTWLRRAPNHPAFLLRRDDWWPREDLPDADFPDSIRIGGVKMALTYRNAPDDPEEDGITCTVRKSDAAALRLWRADWLVPGALPGKLTYLLSTLPSAQRRLLQPFEDAVAGLLAHLKPGSEPLIDAVRHTIYAEWGFRIAPETWANLRLPPHLRVRFRIRDDAGRVLAASRDLEEALAQADVETSSPSVTTRGAPHAADGAPPAAKTWTFGVIPERTTDARAGWNLVHFPALHDDGERGVSLHLFADERAARAAHAAGVTRLYLFALDNSVRVPFRRRQLPLAAQIYLKTLNYDDAQISADILAGAARDAFVRNLPPVRDAAEFERRLRANRAQLVETQAEMVKILGDAVAAAARIEDRLQAAGCPAETVDSIQTQFAWLLYRGFPKNVPLARLRHYKRYLRGAEIRLDRARTNPAGDLAKEAKLAPYWQLYEDAVTGRSKVKFDAAALTEIRWLIEEYRVSLFAQELRTAEPVSPKRLDAKLADAVID